MGRRRVETLGSHAPPGTASLGQRQRGDRGLFTEQLKLQKAGQVEDRETSKPKG